MRVIGAVLSSLLVVSLATAEPAKQADPKDKAKAAAAKPAAPKATGPKAEPKAATKAETKGEKKGETKAVAKPNPLAESYAAIALAERLSIQSDLVWTGDYNGTINGEFGERAIAAVKAFQKRKGGKETGVLNQPERAALAAAAKPKQDAVGWRVVDDLATGARIGVPSKLVPQASTVTGGMRWASSRGEYSVETFRITQPGTTLPAVFERMKKEPADRKPEYSVLRPDFFVISGMQNLKKFYVRAQVRGEEVRGITVLYDQAMAGVMEPVVVAMSSAFSGFPTASALPPPRRKVEYASGVVVAPGHIVTSREAMEGCYVTTVAGIGGADRIADDKDRLVLLRVYAADLKPMALAAEPMKASDVMLLGVPDPQAQGGGGAVSSAKARVSDSLAIEPSPALGFDGAAVLDAQGRLAGLATVKPVLIAGATPAVAPSTTLAPAEAIRKLLAEQKIAANGAAAGSEAAKGSVVRVICVRK
jgi:peptidoglycan hydrolase-like protein with peptidoglycan-binding domain